jgi:Fe-S-cluster containining protein
MRKRPRRMFDRQRPAQGSTRTIAVDPSPSTVPTVVPVAASKPWYHEGIQFGCTRCGACCRGKGSVWLSNPDIARMAQHLGVSIEDFRARYTEEIAVEGQDRPGVRLGKAPHGCIFLDDATNECGVHASKPTQCRTFPFWPMALESPEAWQRDVVALCGREALEQGRIYTAEEILAMSSRIVAVGPVPPGPGRGEG